MYPIDGGMSYYDWTQDGHNEMFVGFWCKSREARVRWIIDMAFFGEVLES